MTCRGWEIQNTISKNKVFFDPTHWNCVTFSPRNADTYSMLEWLDERKIKYVVGQGIPNRLYFASEDDAMLFKLTWVDENV